MLSWHELFDRQSPDSYRYRLSHPLGLVAELERIAELATTSRHWAKHISYIVEELHAVSLVDPVIQRADWLRFQIQELGRSQDAASVKRRCRLIKESSSYTELLEAELLACAPILPKEKERAGRLLRALATDRVLSGADPDSCGAVLNAATDGADAQQALKIIINDTKPDLAEWNCAVEIIGNRRDIYTLFQTGPVVHIKRVHVGGLNEKKENPESVFVWQKLAAKSHVEAARQHLQAVRTALDVANFYHGSSRLQVSGPVFAWRVGVAHQVDLNSHKFLKPRRKWLKRSIDVVSAIGTRLSPRLTGALEHFSVSTEQRDPKVRLASLWTGLEAVVGPGEGSTSERVAQVLRPYVIWRRTEKLVRYFGIALREYAHLDPAIEVLLPGTKGWHIQPSAVLSVVARPENNPEILALLKYCGPHPLLCNRAYELWKEFTAPANLHKSLVAAERRLTWHIERIYRARNMIVHQGEDPPLAGELLINLQYYASVLISRLLSDLAQHPGWSIDDAFVHRHQVHEYLKAQLLANPSSLQMSDLLPDVIEADASKSIWPPSAPSASAKV